MEQVTKHVLTDTTFRGCNPSMIFTDAGTVFIDTPQLISKILEYRKIAEEHGASALIINTEPHIDHIWGNHWFAGECPVIGHENLPGRFLKNLPFDHWDYAYDVINRQDHDCLSEMPKKEDYICNEPTVTFHDRMTVKVGQTELKLYWTPGHTNANICVLYPEEGVLFTGDCIFNQCQTWFNGADPVALLESLKFLKTLEFEKVVPGHGPVAGRDVIDTEIAFVYEWIAAVANGIAKGWTRDECAERISFADRFPVDIGQEEVLHPIQKTNVKSIYDCLMK